jgi:choline kinase
MHALILAGGEGSRLAADGVTEPKPLAEVAGQPQIVRLATTLRRLGSASVTAMVRARFAEPVRQSAARAGLDWLRLLPCQTPSSLHTLCAGFSVLPPGPVFCTMVDTVMRPVDWDRVWAATRAGLDQGAALVLAVTGHVDDDTPLWVQRDPAGYAVAIGAEPVSPACVSGGVYGFSDAARHWAAEALAGGLNRMRAFLGRAVDQGARIATVEVSRIVDLDRARDLDAVRRWLDSLEAERSLL